MTSRAVRRVARYLGPPADPDADLVAAFVARRDPDAFAALVARHGPTVLGVCRRVLGDSHDAEDAFQAVFLVLARKADTVRPGGAVGGWLYGVAVRTASKARVAAARRRRREMNTAQASRGRERPESPTETAELRAVLDEELARLPDAVRAAVVLCDLHGKTRSEAAAELGCPEGTVAARLHRGRKKLADALTRRGLALPAAGLASVLVPSAVSAALSRSASAVAFGAASPVVHALAREVLRAMSTSTKGLAVGLLALVAGAGLVAGTLMSPNTTPDAPAPVGQKPTPAATPAAEQPKRTDAEVWKEQRVLDLTGWLGGSVAWTPDGKMLVVGGSGGRVRALDAATWKPAWDSEVGGKVAAVALAPDGNRVAATTTNGVLLLDAAAGKSGGAITEKGSEPLAVGWFPPIDPGDGGPPLNKLIFGDARGMIVKTWVNPEKLSAIFVAGDRPDGKPADEYAVPLAVAPDGSRVVVAGPIDPDTGRKVLWAWGAGNDVGNKLLEGHKAVVTSAAWSKDSKLIVTGDADGVVITWDAATFKEKSRLALGGRVAAVAVTADGKHVAAAVARPRRATSRSGGYDEEVFVWPTAAPPREPEPLARSYASGPHDGLLASLAFSPDGKQLAAAFCNFTHLNRLGDLVGKVRVFGVEPERPKADPKPAPEQSWKEVVTLTDTGGPVGAVAFAPDGKTFATSGGNNVHLWDAARRERYGTFDGYHPPAFAFAPDGRYVAVTTIGMVELFDPKTARLLVTLDEPEVKPAAVAFGPIARDEGGRTNYRLAFTDGDRVWEKAWADGGNPRTAVFGPVAGAQKADPRPPAGVAYSPDGKRVVFIPNAKSPAGEWFAQVWEPASGKGVAVLPHGPDPVTAVAWSPDGKLIATGSSGVGIGTGDREKGVVILWDAATGQELRRATFAGRDGGATRVNSLAFSPDGKTLAAAVRNGSGRSVHRVGLIDTATGEQVGVAFPGPYGPVRGVAFAPDGKTLLGACGPGDDEPAPGKPAAGAVVVWGPKP